MNISVESFKRVELITISGRIDSSNVSKLDETIDQLHQTGHHNLAFDLSEVNYMSSAGIRALVTAKRNSARGRGSAVIVNPSTRVQEVLELAGLSSFFDIYPDQTAAVGSF